MNDSTYDGRPDETFVEGDDDFVPETPLPHRQSPTQKEAYKVLRQAADTYAKRNLVYGDNYKLVGNVMAALFPEGVTLRTPEDHNRFHIFMLEIVKMTRYTENWDKGGHEDSMLDLSVYAAILVEIDREAKG